MEIKKLIISLQESYKNVPSKNSYDQVRYHIKSALAEIEKITSKKNRREFVRMANESNKDNEAKKMIIFQEPEQSLEIIEGLIKQEEEKLNPNKTNKDVIVD